MKLPISLFAALSLASTMVLAAGPNHLRLPMQTEVPTIDPGLAEASNSIELIEQLFLGLTGYDPETFEVVPELAESWETNEAGDVYTFKLRDDVTWTDGKPVTAQDIEYAIKRNIAPETGSPYSYVLYIIKNAEEANKGEKDPSEVGVTALDDKTIQFELTSPAGFFPALAGLWTYRPLRQDVIEEHGEKWTDPENIVTNGSYRLKEWRRNDQMILEANPDYKIEPVGIPEVRYMIVPEASTALAMYENDELDILSNDYTPVPSPDIDRIKADPVLSQEFSIQPSVCTYFMGFNNKKPPTDNPLVRKAITAAIDRAAITDRILKNGWKPAQTFTPPGVFGSVHEDKSIGIPYDPEQAKKWLEEAGYPNGEGFPELTYLTNPSEQHSQIAQAYQALLKRNLGINIRIDTQEWKVFLKTRKSDDVPNLFRHAWCADYLDAHNWLFEVMHPTKSENEIKWSNEEFAEVVEKAMVSQDNEERKALYRRAEEILNTEETAAGMMFYYADPWLVKPRVLNWSKMPLGGNMIRLWQLNTES